MTEREIMTKKIGLIIKMPTEQASKVEIEERKSIFYNLLARWAFEAYIKDNGMEDMFNGLELLETSNYKPFEK